MFYSWMKNFNLNLTDKEIQQYYKNKKIREQRKMINSLTSKIKDKGKKNKRLTKENQKLIKENKILQALLKCYC